MGPTITTAAIIYRNTLQYYATSIDHFSHMYCWFREQDEQILVFLLSRNVREQTLATFTRISAG